jgi:hypothetical protein
MLDAKRSPALRVPFVQWLPLPARRSVCHGLLFDLSRSRTNACQRFSSSRWPQR